MWLSYSDTYEVSEEGNVRNKQTKNMPGGTKDKDGYIIMTIHNKKVRRARMIASVFCPRIIRLKDEVDHLNGDKSDDRPCNLRWCDKSVNGRNRPATNITSYMTNKGLHYAIQFHKNKKHVFRKTGIETLEKAIVIRDAFKASEEYRALW